MSDASANGPRPNETANGDHSPRGGREDANGRDQSQSSCDTEIRNPPKVGQSDQSGAEIKNIYSSTRQFVIYEAADQIRCLLPDDFEVAKALRQRISELGGLRACIEDWRCDPSLSPNEKMRSARELAWALAQALEDENKPPSDEPKRILTRVEARLRSLVKSHYRKKYCLANLLAFGVIEVILIVVAILAVLWGFTGNMGMLHRYAAYGCFGGLARIMHHVAVYCTVGAAGAFDCSVLVDRCEAMRGATRLG